MALMRFLVIGFVAAVLVACGDDDSSDFATRPSGGLSSACEDCDDSSSSKAKSSSSSAKSSSSVAYVEPCRTDSVDTCEYGTFTDERDGQTYKTVKIGTQTWMAENLNYAYTGVPYNVTPNSSISYTSDSTSWCYRDSVEYCTKYGRLYTWAAAMDSVGTLSTNGKGCDWEAECTPTYPVRGVCPDGWHLPDSTEWETLFAALGKQSPTGKRLKSASGWYSSGNGTDAYAFSALPAGYRYDWGGFGYEGREAFFWSSTEDGSYYAYHIYLRYDNGSANLNDGKKNHGKSVRCVKD